MIKIHNKPRIDRNFFNLIKDIYKKYTANITFNDERLNAFSVRLGRR